MKFIKSFALFLVGVGLVFNPSFVLAADNAETAPYIGQISPDSGPIGTEVTVLGRYLSTDNTVSFNSSFDDAVTAVGVATNNGTTFTFKIPTNLLPGPHNFAISNVFGSSDYFVFNVTDGNVEDPTFTEPPHPEATNVVGPDGTVYRISGSGKNPYTSAGAFLSYKFNSWGSVVNANPADMALPLGTYTPFGSTTVKPYFIPPRNGALILDKGTVYLITGGYRIGFATEAAFMDFGYKYANVYPGDTSFMESLPAVDSINQIHPNGSLINDSGTLQVISYGVRLPFPSLQILDSWGYWASDAVPANTYDKKLPIGDPLKTRTNKEMTL